MNFGVHDRNGVFLVVGILRMELIILYLMSISRLVFVMTLLILEVGFLGLL
jgi:hypothetical protein